MKTLLAAVATVLPLAAAADCPTDQQIGELVASILAGEPIPSLLAGGSMEDAMCMQGKLVDALIPEWGPPVGYKAGLTAKATQERFNATAPVSGVLLRDMIIADGATVPAAFGARALFEADLVVVVADAAINQATTPVEVAAHISAVHPFIELPDLLVGTDQPLDAVVIASGNVGARLGVLGAAIPVEDPAAMAAALETMTVTLTDASGAELSSAPGSAVLGNPLNAVIWLAGEGIEFAPGDLVSVGSIGPLLPPAPGLTATATYRGLPGEPTVSVTFE